MTKTVLMSVNAIAISASMRAHATPTVHTDASIAKIGRVTITVRIPKLILMLKRRVLEWCIPDTVHHKIFETGKNLF